MVYTRRVMGSDRITPGSEHGVYRHGLGWAGLRCCSDGGWCTVQHVKPEGCCLSCSVDFGGFGIAQKRNQHPVMKSLVC